MTILMFGSISLKTAALIILVIIFIIIFIIIAIIAIIGLISGSKKTNSSDKSNSKIGDNSNADSMSVKEKEKYEEEKKKREWQDPYEEAKYVCQGGKVQCKYCSVPLSDIIVTSTTVMLQDKPWATVKDKDGLVNFNFTGQCLHPSQQKPFMSPPPCKAVIQLGEWQDFSKTIIDQYNALAVRSTIPCNISGEPLEIIDSGQRTTLKNIEEAEGTEEKVYFEDGVWTRDPNGKHPIHSAMTNSIVYFRVDMKNTEEILDKAIEVKVHNNSDSDKEKTLYTIDDEKVRFCDIKNNKVIIGFKLKSIRESKLFVTCRVKGANGKIEEARFPKNEEDYLNVYTPFCMDRYKMPGLNKLGKNIADDMTFGYFPLNRNLLNYTIDENNRDNTPQVYDDGMLKSYKKDYSKNGFDENKYMFFTNAKSKRINPSEPEAEEDSNTNKYLFDPKDIAIPMDNTTVAKPTIPERVSQEYTKLIYTKKLIESAKYKGINTGEYVWSYKEYAEFIIKNRVRGLMWMAAEDAIIFGPGFNAFFFVMTDNHKKYYELTLGDMDTPQQFLFQRFRQLVNIFFDFGDLKGNIGKMIDKLEANEGGIFESEQLSNNLAENPATTNFCNNINRYISHVINQSNGDISSLIDDYVYVDDGREGKDTDRRNQKGKQSIRNIMFTWSANLDGVSNVLEGRTIALNDIWAREVYIESFDWIDEFQYKVKYKVILWDHFGLDLPDMEKIFNILPVAREIFACWFLLQHCYGYRPFITKAQFTKEFEGDIRENLSTQSN